MTFKVHKEHVHGKAPPERPICSGSGSMLENVSKYIEHFIKKHGTEHLTYLQDTPDFLRFIEEINEGGKLKEETMILTVDVIGLFTNIPEKSRIRETSNLSTDADRRTDTILERLHDLS